MKHVVTLKLGDARKFLLAYSTNSTKDGCGFDISIGAKISTSLKLVLASGVKVVLKLRSLEDI